MDLADVAGAFSLRITAVGAATHVTELLSALAGHVVAPFRPLDHRPASWALPASGFFKVILHLFVVLGFLGSAGILLASLALVPRLLARYAIGLLASHAGHEVLSRIDRHDILAVGSEAHGGLRIRSRESLHQLVFHPIHHFFR